MDDAQQSNDPPDRDSMLDETIEFWAPLAGRTLTRENARQIRENLTGFFRLLLQWDAEHHEGDAIATQYKRVA